MSTKPDLSAATAVRLSEVAGVATVLGHLVQNGHVLPVEPLAELLCDLNKMHARLEKPRHVLAGAAAAKEPK